MSAAPRREPVSLVVFPEEQRVLDAFAAAGLRVDLIGGSKFETLLGERRRARVFIVQAGAGGSGADILFLDEPVAGVRVCTSTAPSGLSRYEIFIGPRRVSDGEGTAAIYYSISDRYFVQAFGQPAHEVLMRGLGTSPPPC